MFIEILVEELPAIPFLKEFVYFEEKWQKALEKVGITAEATFYFTPRRIVLFDSKFPFQTQDSVLEIDGPPVSIAFVNGDKNLDLTPAGEAFLRKNSLQRSELRFKNKNGKEILSCSYKKSGVKTRDLINEVLNDFLSSLHFGKPMRWAEVKESFIRPIQNVMIFFDNDFISFRGYGIKGVAQTLVRSNQGYEKVDIRNFCHYQEVLGDNGIILNQNERRDKILSEIEQIKKDQGVFVEIDKELLDEVVAITENPKVILGSFEKKYLQLPKEIIITSMKENQRYFAVYQDNDLTQLHHHFIVVSNSIARDNELILKGNEKVLRARLEDAMFFYHNDLKNGLKTQELSQIGFVQGAGSMLDKTHREEKIARFLSGIFQLSEEKKEEIFTSVLLSKSDLLTEVVYEFSNLQGIMGYYYALQAGKSLNIALAIKEQYLPLGENSELPSTLQSSIVALAYKLDNILTLFAFDKIPSGSRDPFGLRRAANGVLRILLNRNLTFHIDREIEKICEILGYQGIAKKVENFFLERLEAIFNVNSSLIKAVLNTGEREICKIGQKINALDVCLTRDKEACINTFKRVANILKEAKEVTGILPQFIQEPAEVALYESYLKIEKMKIDNYVVYMEALVSLRPLLDDFFNQVLVFVDDERIKNNRIALIFRIYQAFLKIGDIKEISF